jgi:hypothetical protein
LSPSARRRRRSGTGLTLLSALGGIVLFVSAVFFLAWADSVHQEIVLLSTEDPPMSGPGLARDVEARLRSRLGFVPNQAWCW